MTLAELLPAMRQLPALEKWLHRHFSTRNASGNILFLEHSIATAPLAMERSKRANCDALDLQSVVRRLTLTTVFLRAALCVCSVLWAYLLFACPKKSRLSLPGF